MTTKDTSAFETTQTTDFLNLSGRVESTTCSFHGSGKAIVTHEKIEVNVPTIHEFLLQAKAAGVNLYGESGLVASAVVSERWQREVARLAASGRPELVRIARSGYESPSDEALDALMLEYEFEHDERLAVLSNASPLSNDENWKPVSERELWTNRRNLVFLVGGVGAGKTVLAERLAARCERYGFHAIRTIDSSEGGAAAGSEESKAPSRELSEQCEPAAHDEIVQKSLRLIESWRLSKASLVAVDGWYVADVHNFGLPDTHVGQIEAALSASGFDVTVVHLIIAPPLEPLEGPLTYAAMLDRLKHTRLNRPDAWWDETLGTVQQRAQAELERQVAERKFVERMPFRRLCLWTNDMRWDSYTNIIVDSLKSIQLSTGMTSLEI